MKHYQETGNVSATCREFGISRDTFYRWLKRYDPEKSSKPLRSRSRKRLSKRSTKWTKWDLIILAELDNRGGSRLGAGKAARRLQQYDINLSRATIGRRLAKIRRYCPICRSRVRRGGHDTWGHLLSSDLLTWETKVNEGRARSGLPELNLLHV